MTAMYLHPLRYEVSSTPIRTSPPGTGMRASESLASTLEHIEPTVRQDTLMSFRQAALLIESAHQQQASSKAYVNRGPCAAQGTSLAAIPHSGHDTPEGLAAHICLHAADVAASPEPHAAPRIVSRPPCRTSRICTTGPCTAPRR